MQRGKKNKKILIFDFDGVIVDSVSLKGEAFAELFSEINEEFKNRIRCYHKNNPALTRHEKIREFSSWLGKSLHEDEEQFLLNRFSAIVLDKSKEIQLLPGAEMFLKKNTLYPMYIVSKADAQEIKQILALHKLSFYFKGIYGIPWEKTLAIQDIIKKEMVESGDVVYFGDSPSDRISATEAGVRFIEVKNKFPQNLNI